MLPKNTVSTKLIGKLTPMKKLLTLFILFALPYVMFAQLTVTISTTNVSCNSNCDGSATANVTGGTPPYTYLWTPTSNITPAATNLCAGTYTVTVTDAIATTATATCTINQPNALSVTGVANPASTVCAGANVSFVLSVSGGTPPYTYNWSLPGATPPTSSLQNPTVAYNTPGNYNAICTVSDANGCVGSLTIAITVSGGPTMTLSHVPSTCNQSNGTMSASGALSYWWQPGNLTTASISGIASGITYTVTGTSPSGCTSTATMMSEDSCDYVWPGDANDDAVADNIDILDIGIANGATGTTRANASLTWIGQPSVAWGTTLVSGTDYKWVDCDGNGTIAPADTQAVTLNYGMTHNNRYIAPTYSAVAPDLSISFDQDSVGGGNTGTMTLALGNSTTQAVGVYGLAFRLNYDAAQISTSSIGLIGGTSWFGTPGNDMMRVVLHPNAAMGYVDVAITRLDQQNMSGFGTIAQIYFTATTALNGTGNTQDVPMTLTNIVLIDNAEVPQAVNAIGDTVVVGDDAIITSVVTNESAGSSVYPNPANEHINFTIAGTEKQLVTIEDINGRVVYSQYHNAGANTVAVASLPAGAYVLRVTSNNGGSTIDNITIAH